jgi:putative hemolysin
MLAWELLVIVALVLVNGVLAGAEIAIVAMRETRINELIGAGNSAALAVQQLRRSPERFLATVQVGITVVSATAGAFGGAAFAADLAPVISTLLPIFNDYAHPLAFAVVVLCLSYLSLVLGELVPKSLALRSSEKYALFIGRPLLWLSGAVRPLIWVLTASSNAVLKLFGDRTSFIEARLSPEELRQLLEEAGHAGTLHPRSAQIATRALGLSELTAADAMVPRDEVVAVSRYASPAYYVLPTTKAIDLLTQMQKRSMPFAIVLEERGGLAGVVTIENLVEELVGKIFSEQTQRPTEHLHAEADGTVTVPANTPVRNLNRELSFELPEEGDYTTVGGLCMVLSGRIPKKGTTLVTHEGYGLEILDSSPRRIGAVRVHPPAAHPHKA